MLHNVTLVTFNLSKNFFILMNYSFLPLTLTGNASHSALQICNSAKRNHDQSLTNPGIECFSDEDVIWVTVQWLQVKHLHRHLLDFHANFVAVESCRYQSWWFRTASAAVITSLSTISYCRRLWCSVRLLAGASAVSGRCSDLETSSSDGWFLACFCFSTLLLQSFF